MPEERGHLQPAWAVEEKRRESRQEAAELVQVNDRYISDAKKIATEAATALPFRSDGRYLPKPKSSSSPSGIGVGI